jgi:nucleotide-binding universal stress UspA family protein
MTTILVPLDGSSLAEQGLTFAEQLARVLPAKLRLALVHEPAAVATGPVARAQMALHRAEREYLGRVRDRLKTAGITDVTAVVLKGDPREELTRYAGERDPDLVVIASHGRGGIARAWFGSVAEHLVRSVAAPVLVVHAREPTPGLRAPQRIAVALDGSKAAEMVLDSAAQLARAFGAELLLCRVVQPVPLPADPILPVTIAYDTELTDQLLGGSDDYLARVSERFAETGIPIRRRSLVGHGVAATLIDAARDEGADLIVMTTRGRGGLGRLGSVADKVMRGAPCPVLLYRRQRR